MAYKLWGTASFRATLPPSRCKAQAELLQRDAVKAPASSSAVPAALVLQRGSIASDACHNCQHVRKP